MIKNIIQTAKDNPIFATLIGMYGLGVMTFLLKDVPKALYTFIVKQVTTSVIIQNKNICFYRLMNLLESHNISNKLRVFRFYNGRWGSSSSIIKGLGDGEHIILYKKIPIKVSFKNNTSASFDNTENLQVTLTKLGRSHKLFDEIKKELEKEETNLIGKVSVQSWYDNYWQEVDSIPKRPLDSVLLDQDKKESLLNRLNSFLSSEKWYIANGVPYQLGILLYGPPGTGKTSLIKALAGMFDFTLCILPASYIYAIQKAVATLPERAILVIEDIDSASAIHKRETTDDGDIKNSEEKVRPKSEASIFVPTSLSDILNSVDGILSKHGRILVTTTNAPDKIDSAFLRPGRIDLKIELGYVNNELFLQFIKNFYGVGLNMEERKLIVKDKVTISQLQNSYLNGSSVEEIISEFCLK